MISAQSGKAIPDGVDCTAIPNVLDVSCQRGKCVVRRCDEGFIIDPLGQSCVRLDALDESPELFASQPGSGQILVN